MDSYTKVASEQMLVMLDSRGFEIRQLYLLVAIDFVMTYLPKQWMDVFRIPPRAHRHIAAAPLKFSVSEMGIMQEAKGVKVALQSGKARDTGPHGGRYGEGSIH